jgi:hypothetical protein
MMMPMRPEVIQNTHLLCARLAKQVTVVNAGEPLKNRWNADMFWMLHRLTFLARSASFVLYLVEVRIPLVAGLACPNSFGCPVKGELFLIRRSRHGS